MKTVHALLPIGRPLRRGFTLVELLVVMTIIGILIALLLPAVQAAREAARHAQCTNNLKQLALGALNHEQAFRYLPTGGWGWSWVGDPDQGYGVNQPGGWIYNLLPFIEQENLHNIGAGQPAATEAQLATTMVTTPVAIFHCPSRRQAILYPYLESEWGNNWINVDPLPTMVTRTDYAANCGDASLDQYMPGPPDENTGINAPVANVACKNCNGQWNGSWDNTFIDRLTGVSYERSKVTMGMIKDGASNTYYCGEKYLDPDNYLTGADAADNECPLQGFDNDMYRSSGGGRNPETDPPNPYYPPMQDTPGIDNDLCWGSVHPAGALMALCDGSVHNVSFYIDPETHRRLANRADYEPLDASKEAF